jgi:hypothetical protein
MRLVTLQVIDRFVERYRAADDTASEQNQVFSSEEEKKLGARLAVWRGRGFSAREIYDAFLEKRDRDAQDRAITRSEN